MFNGYGSIVIKMSELLIVMPKLLYDLKKEKRLDKYF